MKTSSDHTLIWRAASLDGVDVFNANLTRFTYARHSHDAFALGVVQEGAMRFWHKGIEYVVGPGEVIAINPGEVHDGRAGASSGCRYRMLYIERSTIDHLLAPDLPYLLDGVAGPVLHDSPLAQSFYRLHRSLKAKDDDEACDHLQQQMCFIQVLYNLFSRYGRPPLRTSKIDGRKQHVWRAKEYLIEHLTEPVKLAELSVAVGLSPYHLLRTFKRATGLPPHSFMNQARLDLARVLLRRDEPPAQVAAALGFVDQSHFTRRFRAAFGITPGQYAKARRDD